MRGLSGFLESLCLSAAVGLLCPPALRSQDGSTDPCTWISARMLGGLGPDLLAERQGLVADSLARFPGSGETFIVALVNAGFQDAQWKDPGLGLFYPLPPALLGGAWGGRSGIYSLQPGRPLELPLGRGDYTYPYLEDGGRAAFVTKIDWLSGRMTLFGADVHKGSVLEEIFGAPDIGVIRVSGDGSRFGYLGPRGLHVGPTKLVRGARFCRGDANADGATDISDAIAILGFLFLGGTMNDCEDAADVNDDGKVDISDAVRLLGHLFLGSERPPDPFGMCGGDSTGDEIGCNAFSKCP